MVKKVLHICLFGLFLSPNAISQTDVYLETARTGGGTMPIVIGEFETKESACRSRAILIRNVLTSDLNYSGYFIARKQEDIRGEDSLFTAVAIVQASLRYLKPKLLLEVELRDFASKEIIFEKAYRFSAKATRTVAHRLANEIVYFLVGEEGIAETRILFCRKNGASKDIYIIDYDGYNEKRLTTGELALSPLWLDRSRFCYTSYKRGNPDCYLVDLFAGKKWLISSRKGLNIAGSYFAPRDELAMTISVNGNSEIYVLKSNGEFVRRLTRNRAIDCSPSWSANGAELAFVSDRTGTPQIYIMDRFGGHLRRLSYDSAYNTSPAWSPDGEMIAYVSREDGLYRLKLISPDGLSEETLYEDYLSYEDPVWAPDSRHIAATVRYGGKPWIVIIDIETKEKRRLAQGESPSWSR